VERYGEVVGAGRWSLIVVGHQDLNEEELHANVPMVVGVHVVAVEALTDLAPLSKCRQGELEGGGRLIDRPHQ
jgi:hypothetical protein